MRLIKFHLIFFLSFMLPLSSVEKSQNIYVCTIPKAGTHCIKKYFNLLTYQSIDIPHKIKCSHFSEKHLKLPKDYFFRDDVKKIILVRDLRDVFLSALNWIETKRHWMSGHVAFRAKWRSLSQGQKLRELIDYNSVPENIIWSYNNRNLPQQIHKIITKAVALSQCRNALVVKYESLSGAYGPESQKATICEINKFIGVCDLTNKQHAFIEKNLYGNALLKSPTYREGNINNWAKRMSPKMQKYIWDLYGKELAWFNYLEKIH